MDKFELLGTILDLELATMKRQILDTYRNQVVVGAVPTLMQASIEIDPDKLERTLSAVRVANVTEAT